MKVSSRLRGVNEEPVAPPQQHSLRSLRSRRIVHTMAESSSTSVAFARAAPQLLETGYAVVDDAISPALAAELHACCAALHESRVLRQHRFGFRPSASAKPQIFEKPHIFECELGEPQFLASEHAQRLLAALAALDCADSARAAFPELRLLPGVDAVTVKLQCNEGGGGCFPLHYDNAGPPSKRRLTCLVYLNPGWADGDGGELQLAPSPSAHPGFCLLYTSDAADE